MGKEMLGLFWTFKVGHLNLYGNSKEKKMRHASTHALSGRYSFGANEFRASQLMVGAEINSGLCFSEGFSSITF